MVCSEASRSCKARMNLPIAFSIAVVRFCVILLLYLQTLACCADGAACTRGSAAPTRGAYKSAWSICRRAPKLSVRYADLPHFQPYAWHNCDATCARSEESRVGEEC